jgi:hypothetical protein
MRNTVAVAAGLLVGAAFLGGGTPVGAGEEDTDRIEKIERDLETLAEEIASLRIEKVEDLADAPATGLGPAASKIYTKDRGMSLAGYGEFVYTHFDREDESGKEAGAKDRIDALRTILYVGYKFSDAILLNSELEFEHGGAEVSTEFAYLEFRVAPGLGVRGGLLLVPLGIVNEIHEPPTFVGAERPEVERFLIPTTWRANGVGFSGNFEPAAVRVYLVEGLRAEGFSASGGLRGGRQNGKDALAETWGLVARGDVEPVVGLTLGSGIYVGNSGQGLADSLGVVSARTVIWEAHGEIRYRGAVMRGLAVLVDQDDVGRLNALLELKGDASIGERMAGFYIEAAYDVMPLLAPGARDMALIPFVRYLRYNTQDEVPAGFMIDPAQERSTVTAGVSFKPHPQVAVKADLQIRTTEAESGVNRFHLGLGYLF